MVNKIRKFIAFDLSQEKLREFYIPYSGKDRTSAYEEIGKEFAKFGFLHDQGSAYFSEEKLTNAEARDIVKQVSKNLPWLGLCMTKIKITNIDEHQYDLLPYLQRCSKKNEQKLKSEQAKKKAKKSFTLH